MRLKRKTFEASLPSMAMGDIAFLLLIFFVILARAQNDDSHIRWTPSQIEDLQPGELALARVAIDQDNRLFLNGKEINIASLQSSIEGIYRDKPAEERIVLFKVHHDVHATHFEPAIEAIGSAGADVFHVLEEKDDE